MKYVLIPGAAGGMGNKTAMYLAAQGFCVFAMDRVAVAAQKNIIPLQCDITDAACVQAAVQAVKKETDVLYAILHFAGIYTLDSFVEIETERFQHILQVNLLGAFLVNKFFMPLLHRGSRIIITTSELAPLAPLPFTGIYAVSKTALDRYAYALQMELQLLGISVSVIRAGAVATDMLDASVAALNQFCKKTKLYSCNAARFQKIVASVESRRVPPQKIAQKAACILQKKHPKFAYAFNRNPLLILMNILPQPMQFYLIRRILR